jgi:hypothetical protein
MYSGAPDSGDADHISNEVSRTVSPFKKDRTSSISAIIYGFRRNVVSGCRACMSLIAVARQAISTCLFGCIMKSRSV